MWLLHDVIAWTLRTSTYTQLDWPLICFILTIEITLYRIILTTTTIPILDCACRANRGQSLCAEMASELRFAVRCGSRQRPSAKARSRGTATLCSRGSPHSSLRGSRYCSNSQHEETTYIPSIEIPRLNGVSPVLHDESVDLTTVNKTKNFINFFQCCKPLLFL